jgi:hypothetical protein
MVVEQGAYVFVRAPFRGELRRHYLGGFTGGAGYSDHLKNSP